MEQVPEAVVDPSGDLRPGVETDDPPGLEAPLPRPPRVPASASAAGPGGPSLVAGGDPAEAVQAPEDVILTRGRVFSRALSSPSVPSPLAFPPGAGAFSSARSAPGTPQCEIGRCCDCPPPLVRSVETGECELPELAELAELAERAERSDIASDVPVPPVEPAAPAPAPAPGATPAPHALDLTRSDSVTSRPKFKVVSQPLDDGDLLRAIAELACRLEQGADLTEAEDTDAMTSDEDAKVVPRGGGGGADSVHSDGGLSADMEGRTVTAAEAATLSRTLSERGDAEDSKRGPDPGRRGGRIVSLEEAVRLTGQGWFHARLLLVSGVLVMAGVLETVVVGYLLPSASRELGMQPSDKALLGAASYAGIVLSSHTWGLVADTRGRKRALLWATLLDVVASLLSAIAPNFAVLLALRFCCGLFTSAPAALSFAYLGEFHTPATRSKSIIWIGAFPSLGLILLPAAAWAVLPQCWWLDLGFVRFGPWRLLLVLCALLSLLSALLLWLAVPESPKFLAGRDPERALAVLRRMFALNKGLSEDLYPVDGLAGSPGTKPTVSTVELGDEKPAPASSSSSLGVGRTLRLIWEQTAPLFRPPFLLHTTLVCLIQFGNLASANGLQIWLPEIFNKLAQYEEAHPGESASICAAQDAYRDDPSAAPTDRWDCVPVNVAVFKNNLIIGAVSLAMPLLCGLLVNAVGKRNLLVVCLIVSGTFGVGLSFANSSGLVLGLSSVSVAINSMGIGHISSIVVELFPTHLRAMAVSLHLMAGRTGSIVGNLIFGALLSTHCPWAFYAIGGALLTCAVLSCCLPSRGKYAA